MASGGAQSGSQNQTQQTATQGNNSGTAATGTIGQTLNNTTGTNVSSVNAPSAYQPAWESLLGGGGNTAGQTAASNYFTGRMGAPSYTAAAAPGVTAGTVNGTNVNAQTGQAFQGAYANPYEDQVVQSTLSDLGRQYGVARNADKMAATAAGAYGGSGSALRAAQTSDNFLRTAAGTVGGLRSAGFNTSAGLGQQDASRNLVGQQSNQATNAAIEQANADRALQAQQFNSGQTAQNNQFNVGAQYQGQAGRDAAAGNVGNVGAQTFSQRLAALGAGTPLFGQTNTATGSQIGSNLGLTAGQTASMFDNTGTSNTQGKSSSKGGGVAL